MFGAQTYAECTTDDCRAASATGYKLVPDPAYAQYADYVIGRCGADPTQAKEPLSAEAIQARNAAKVEPAAW